VTNPLFLIRNVMTNPTVKLPDRETMLTRLIKVDDGEQLREQFFPLLLKYADHTTSVYGVADILVSAIKTYTSDKPVFICAVIGMLAPLFLEALIKDPLTAKAAKNILPQAIAAA
jgi:hypothetical protein